MFEARFFSRQAHSVSTRLVSLVGLILALNVAACSRNPAAVPQPPPPSQPSAVEPGVDTSKLGPRERPLFWTPEQQQAGYGHMDLIYPVRAIEHARQNSVAPFPLPVELRDLSKLQLPDAHSIDDFRTRFKIAGMLILKRGRVLYEQYAHGHTATTRWTSWSVAKSVVSLLVGAAVKDGFIRLDARAAEYLPVLAEGSYAPVTVLQLMEMKTGVGWNEDYQDPSSDVNNMAPALRGGTLALARSLGGKPRVAEPGERWNYNTGETYLLGAVLRGAIGNNLSSYLSRKVWSRFAMESDGYWMLDSEYGDEQSGCCLSATLRDYGRIGLFALRGGTLPDGTSVLPDAYMAQSTQRKPPAPWYGRMWWLNDHSYSARGIFGQNIRIYPDDDLIIVTHGLSKAPAESFNYANRLFDGINEALKGK
jgi:CubicO group peptidase (beta-lactamase class C family)